MPVSAGRCRAGRLQRALAALLAAGGLLLVTVPAAAADQAPAAARPGAKAGAKSAGEAAASGRRAAAPGVVPVAARRAAAPAAIPMRKADHAEARLLAIYALWGRGQGAQALAQARELVRDQPGFRAAQLIYADLLSARLAPARRRQAWQGLQEPVAAEALGELRDESARRLQALLQRPPQGAIPAQLLAVAPASRHALAVDVSRSRLYVFRNTPQGLALVADYYASIGKAGAGKQAEGDARTPLGIYHVTSKLSPKGLRDFYGAGALPINYPNPYDQRVGRTGSGIWLHGTPPGQYARAPQATDGCVVLADEDLRQIIRITDAGATVVAIAQQLDWIPAARADAEAEPLRRQILAWRDARAQGDLVRWQSFYLPDAVRTGRLARRHPSLRDELAHAGTQPAIELKELSVLRWRDGQDLMLASFGEVAQGARTGALRRQYWLHSAQGWKIFHEE